MEAQELRAALEAILFVSNEPVKIDELADSFPDEGKEAILAQLEEIRRVLDGNVQGFMLEQAGGGWRLATRPEHDSILRKYFAKKGENRLSIAALETLAIVAYRQPITAPEVSELRGVNSNAVLRTLMERRMIRVSGRKNVVGSPFLYRTTREFLVHFGLNDIRDLPRLEEFGDLIGENINEDLVAAINAAGEAAEANGSEVVELAIDGDAEQEAAAALAESGTASDDAQDVDDARDVADSASNAEDVTSTDAGDANGEGEEEASRDERSQLSDESQLESSHGENEE